MKRTGHLYERIAEPENLRLAFLKSVRGKRGKQEVVAYAQCLDDNLRALREQLLARRIKDADVLRLSAAIIGTYHTQPGRGLPIGNLVSQHLANFYLGHLDHWVKETLRVAGYVRYMDDFVLWAGDRAELAGHLAAVRGFLDAELGLALKENVQLNRSERGGPFLGYRVFPCRLALGPRARGRFARKLRAYERECHDGAWSEADLARQMEALLSYVRFADTVALRRRIVAKYDTAA